MDRTLLSILRCPRCSESLDLRNEVLLEDRVEEAELICESCAAEYQVVGGVPQLRVENGLISKTRQGFAYQWRKRLDDRAENRSVVYGYDIHKFMNWFAEEFASDIELSPQGEWMLDAGCGSAEKAHELALKYPEHRVVAIDQSDSIVATARENRHIKNLYFVQANVWYPPFAKNTFQFAMSIGVLHHTPNTLRAFQSIASLIKPHGGLMTWLYPLPHEDAFWEGLYRQRDKHFLGLAHRLPNWLIMLCCRLYVGIFYKQVLRFAKTQFERNRKVFPIYPDKPSKRGFYKSFVFLSFDNLMPPHQFRHGRPEVRSWYQAEGFGEVNDKYAGFFHAKRLAPVAQVTTKNRETLIS